MVTTYMELKKVMAGGIDNFPMFFAFSDAQFIEGKQKLGVSDNKDLLSIGSGGYIKKSDRDLFTSLVENNDTAKSNFLKVPSQLKEALIYELGNHEYCITHETSDTLTSLDLEYETMTTEQKDILQQAINEYMATVEY